MIKTARIQTAGILVLMLWLTLTGCAVHRPYAIDLPVPVPESFEEGAGDGVPLQRWWETFDDSRLNALMDRTFSGNLDLAQAYARLEQVEAVRRSTRSGQLPTLEAGAQGSREDTPGFFGNNTGDGYRLSLAAAFELDLWQKRRSQTRAANDELRASREELQTLYLSLSALTADLYYLAVEQRAQLALTDGTIASFSDTVDLVERRYREGLVSPLDVYQARQSLAAAKARRPDFQATLATTEHALAVLLGDYPQGGTFGDVVALPEAPEAFPAGLPSQVLARRPDVAAAFHRVRASDARVAAAIADRFPSINLLGGWGRSSTAFSTGDIEGEFWTLLADLTLPLIDGGRRRAEADRAKGEFRESLATYQKTVLTAFQEVEDALAMNRATEERIAGLEEEVEAAAGALRMSMEHYLQGLSDYLPVLTAQASHFTADSLLLAARRQLISDRVSLARALGGDWMTGEIEKRLTAGDGVKGETKPVSLTAEHRPEE